MSLGQLTADYADSDEEQMPEESSKLISETPKDAPPPPTISPLGSPSKVKSSDSKEDRKDPSPPTEKVPDKKEVDSPESSPKLDINSGLSGVIVDDDDDQPSPPVPESSPSNQRVGELRTAEGGSGRATPSSNTGSLGSNKNTPVKKVSRLVSYYNEEDDVDDDSNSEDDEVLHSEPMDTGTDGDDDNSQPTPASGGVGSRGPSSPHGGGAAAPSAPGGGVTIDGIKLPPAPVGKKCSQALQDKIAKAVADMRRGHWDYNTIQNKKEFRNPSIYEKLVDHLRLNENGTNYPVALYDPHCWGKESFYEELARVQKEEMEKREREKKDKTKVDFVSGTKKGGGSGAEEEIKKRKSRFDSGRPEGPTAASVTKPVGLMSSLPSSVGPKTTIDAFGSLNKKLKT